MDYHAKEQRLFARWQKRAQELRDGELMTKDGMLYRGEVWWDGINQASKRGNETELWDVAPLRLLIMTKEVDDEDAFDLRTETGRVPSPHMHQKTAYRFFPNLELWAYGLLNITGRKAMSFDKADNEQKRQEFYETAPIVRINCKKKPEAKAASNAILTRYMENYADILKDQISVYRANIIMCCGGQGIMVDFLKRHVFSDLEEMNRYCYYSPMNNVLVVKMFHPCYNVYSRKDMYTNLISAYQAFLKATPNFPVKK